MRFTKLHGLGNDFLVVSGDAGLDAARARELARRVCERHTGVGADGLIVYSARPDGAVMRLHNADGSRAEVSGNGVRCLAAWLLTAARVEGRDPRAVVIDTEAGPKRLSLVSDANGRFTFRAAMGPPAELAERDLDVAGELVRAVTLRVGNPQCVVLGEVSDARLQRLGLALATHPAFPEGTNVEFAEVESHDHVRILIWERGVGPTLASGTGACAAAVAAAAYGGASRHVYVTSPGGTQRVEWLEDELYLTGSAEIVLTGEWIAQAGE